MFEEYGKKCPVCGKHEFAERGAHEVCPVCGWVDDLFQNVYPLNIGGNPMSLEKAREMYKNRIPRENYDYSDIEYIENKHKCPVCGLHEFQNVDDGEVCPVCGWVDDTEQMLRPDKALKSNKMSLNEAKKMWQDGVSLSEFNCDGMNLDDFDNLQYQEHLCPVCGQYEFAEFGSFDICPYCEWEDDIVPIDEKDGELIYDEDDEKGTCNPCCLREAKEKWRIGKTVRE